MQPSRARGMKLRITSPYGEEHGEPADNSGEFAPSKKFGFLSKEPSASLRADAFPLAIGVLVALFDVTARRWPQSRHGCEVRRRRHWSDWTRGLCTHRRRLEDATANSPHQTVLTLTAATRVRDGSKYGPSKDQSNREIEFKHSFASVDPRSGFPIPILIILLAFSLADVIRPRSDTRVKV